MTRHATCRGASSPGPLAGATAGAVTLLVLAVAFSLHALDVSWAWVAYPLGFGGLLPAAMGVAARYDRDGRSGRHGDRSRHGHQRARAQALETLRLRYARGELDELAFERRVERLLETETVEGAADRYGADE